VQAGVVVFGANNRTSQAAHRRATGWQVG